jgi:tRNA threonylcarbamoyladenosine biosynthesis protein TsaE
MTLHSAAFTSTSPDETAHLATRLGAVLTAGDTVLLEGEIGAGKSHFARALILSRLPEPEDVPSPTFTIVQVYELAECDLWHTDLYRLGGPDQVVELGLLDAFQTGICIVEWPDRLDELRPAEALTIRLDDPEKTDLRQITFSWSNPAWSDRVTEVLA